MFTSAVHKENIKTSLVQFCHVVSEKLPITETPPPFSYSILWEIFEKDIFATKKILKIEKDGAYLQSIRKNKIATRSHVSPAAAEKWECNVLQVTCKFGDTIL